MTNSLPFSGLSASEVEERQKAGQDNKPVKAPSKSVTRIIFEHVFTYFNGVFAAIALVLILVQSYRDLTFLGIIFANTLIGIIQELRTKNVLDGLTLLATSKTKTVRDGEIVDTTTDDLVLDDIVLFHAGDQIPADAEVLSGEVSVNEALLTGEADELEKSRGAELLSGSFVVSGECYARLTRVGEDSYISKLTLRAKAIKSGEQSEIIRSLNRIVKLAGIAVVPVGLLLFSRQYFLNHFTIQASVQGAASAILGMIPEGLFLLSSVSLAIGAVKLAREKVLIREMKCIETLARVDVLCVDKTGTITDSKMSVREVVNLEGDGEALAEFARAFPADNATALALKEYFKKSPKANWNVVKTFGFSSKEKYSAVEFKEGKFVLGAPEFVLKSDLEKYKKDLQKFSRKGYRVLIFGKYSGELGGELKAPVTPLSIIVLENPVRPTASETFRYFRDQGVAIKVISGDNALAVSEVAREAGIDGAGKYVDASTLTDDASLRLAVEKYTVFGRVTPEQKRKIVKFLQKEGHYVAMTGDGVNDVLALKDADCSVALASGSDAAVQTAQIVLLESDFSKMPDVVLEGRRVVNNLERSGSLFIVKNVFSLLAAVSTLLLGIHYPLLPAQVSMLSVWTIGLPSFFLSQIPNKSLIKGRFLSNVLSKAIPGGLVCLVVVFLMVLSGEIFGIPETETTTACTLAFATVSTLYLYQICRPLDRHRGIIFFGCIISLASCFLFFRPLFSLADEVSLVTIITCAALALVAWPLLEHLPKLLESRLDQFVARFDQKPAK